VCEVLNIAGHDIEDPPNFDTLYVLGIAKLKGAVKVLLKIEDVLTLKELRGSICSRIANADGNL
jgi:hypothetical protein